MHNNNMGGKNLATAGGLLALVAGLVLSDQIQNPKDREQGPVPMPIESTSKTIAHRVKREIQRSPSVQTQPQEPSEEFLYKEFERTGQVLEEKLQSSKLSLSLSRHEAEIVLSFEEGDDRVDVLFPEVGENGEIVYLARYEEGFRSRSKVFSAASPEELAEKIIGSMRGPFSEAP